MNQNYFYLTLFEYLDKVKPIITDNNSEEELLEFIQQRVQLAEKEFELHRRKGIDVLAAQEIAQEILFEGLMSEEETFLRDLIEKSLSDLNKTMSEGKELNTLIKQLLPLYHVLKTNAEIPYTQIKHELITKIDNLILSNGF
ncbi:hypothetical protein Emtol_0307 (plasmid) [Emticicia oligotrophica DSM 17448]|uniref:Uncharacterized protein n=1 Tax=Emticicia oligotrophica (strain DSM 17448 / CIP 109782 / MTCC 6937 / GPTSA100-15) TaxID=929562 RepID=A0ABN4ASI9_EMTOG|nr:DUF1896 family protein [Emticicia oligotrophica]AFK05574.1 hypothetical protein Emtol_0307 [Emticicia oligotrophica DSM 17448]